MSRQDHWCLAMRAVGHRGPSMRLEANEDGPGWTLFFEDIASPVGFCPFCGVELSIPLDSALMCQKPVPVYQKCERAVNHPGNHRASWSL